MNGRVLWGPLSRMGFAAALASVAVDQLAKLWLIFDFDLPARGPVPLASFLDLVLIWNTGISYGLFQHTGPAAQWALLGLRAGAVLLLWVWLARTTTRLTVRHHRFAACSASRVASNATPPASIVRGMTPSAWSSAAASGASPGAVTANAS